MSNATAPPGRKTLITVATYNERENLPSLVDEIFRHAPECDILVIDDNSPDGTGRWVEERGETEPRLKCLHRAGKLGLGSATVAGLEYGLRKEYDYVLNMDADFSHHPKYLPAIIAGMDPVGAPPVDVMIGSRYIAGGGTEGWPLKRKLMSRGLNLYARTLLGLSPKDCSGAFRCYRAAILSRLDFSKLLSTGYSFQEEVLWMLKQQGARFAETPIIFCDRTKGTSKIDSGEAAAALRIIFQLAIRNFTGPKTKARQ